MISRGWTSLFTRCTQRRLRSGEMLRCANLSAVEHGDNANLLSPREQRADEDWASELVASSLGRRLYIGARLEQLALDTLDVIHNLRARICDQLFKQCFRE